VPVPSAPVSVRVPPCFAISILTRDTTSKPSGVPSFRVSPSRRRSLQTPCPEQPRGAARSARAALFDCRLQHSQQRHQQTAQRIERRTAAQCCAPIRGASPVLISTRSATGRWVQRGRNACFGGKVEKPLRGWAHCFFARSNCRRELRSSAYGGIYRDRRFRGARRAGRRQCE
jgi:hypothetical protein